jgi:hypothetical protein
MSTQYNIAVYFACVDEASDLYNTLHSNMDGIIKYFNKGRTKLTVKWGKMAPR